MSHDRGCFCGREKWEYVDCPKADCDRNGKSTSRRPLPSVQPPHARPGMLFDAEKQEYFEDMSYHDTPKMAKTRTSLANDIQHGGDHYKSEYQHWDFAERNGLGYLESAATKYLTRHADKAGKLDLEKAGHYTQKLKDLFNEGVRMPKTCIGFVEINRFCNLNNVVGSDRVAFINLCTWATAEELASAIVYIYQSIEENYPDEPNT